MKRVFLLLLALVIVAVAWITIRSTGSRESQLKARFLHEGTNSFARGHLALVFELQNQGIQPLVVQSHGIVSDWRFAEALTTSAISSLDHTWFSTNLNQILPPKGTMKWTVFASLPAAESRLISPNTSPRATPLTWVEGHWIWRFRFKSRAMGLVDVLPDEIWRLFAPGSKPRPAKQESIADLDPEQIRQSGGL